MGQNRQRIISLEKALRKVDEIRHRMERSGLMRMMNLVDDLKGPCMVLFAEKQLEDKGECEGGGDCGGTRWVSAGSSMCPDCKHLRKG